MKLETMKAWLQKTGQAESFLKDGMAEGEYFLLSPEMTDAIYEFISKSGSELDFISIADIKLPYEEFSIELVFRDEDIEKGLSEVNPNELIPTRRLIGIKRIDDQILVTVCDRMFNKMAEFAMPRSSLYVFTDGKNFERDGCALFGDGDWRISLSKEKIDSGEDPAFGIALGCWNKKVEKYWMPMSVDSDEPMDHDWWSKEMLNIEFKTGPTIATQALLMAMSLSLIKTGIAKTRSQCSIINPKKSKESKRRAGTRKHFFTTVTLDAVEIVKGREIVRREGVTAHTVRGHFKKRKSGLFWWNPFVRGSGKVRERDGYIVKG